MKKFSATIILLTTLMFSLHAQTASFNQDVNSGCGPVCVNFSDQSTNPVSWYWDFGDGNNSTTQNPMYCYSTPGSYQVTLVVTFASSTGTATGNVTVYPDPVAAFTSTSTSGNVFSFTDQSMGATSWMWSFGDSTFSSLQNPVHTYNFPGVDTVCLIATSSNGCIDSTCHQETVVAIGMEEHDTHGSFGIFPVPSQNGIFTIQFDATLDGEISVIIENALGETVLREMISGTKSFDLSGAVNGFYFVRVGNAEPRKLIIQN